MVQVLPPEPAPIVAIAPAPSAAAPGTIERSVATEGEEIVPESERRAEEHAESGDAHAAESEGGQ